jgi:hypothetical protein
MRTCVFRVLFAIAMMLAFLTTLSGAASTQASAAGSPITIAYVTSLTGPGASEEHEVDPEPSWSQRCVQPRWLTRTCRNHLRVAITFA